MTDGIVCGVGVTYNIDGIILTKIHKGSNRPTSSYELKLHNDEHLVFISAHHSEDGIHDIILKSNHGNMLVMDEESERINSGAFDTTEINLEDHNSALVGFKGMFEDSITRLSIYSAQIITEHETSDLVTNKRQDVQIHSQGLAQTKQRTVKN